MKISVLTLFPNMIKGVIGESLIKRGLDNGLFSIEVYDIRDYADNKHRQTDDYTYGGGEGLLMMPQPVFSCMDVVMEKSSSVPHRIFTSPRGKQFCDADARRLAEYDEIVILCGHYEGMDERVCEAIIDEEISIGDFVLTGGEIAALAIIDAMVRFIPGVLGNAGSAHNDSFGDGLLEYPQYTRPRVFRGMEVPEVLLNGNHADINKWRREQSLRITKERRPDLLEKAELSQKDKEFLETI